jgi:hypothetical protein
VIVSQKAEADNFVSDKVKEPPVSRLPRCQALTDLA